MVAAAVTCRSAKKRSGPDARLRRVTVGLCLLLAAILAGSATAPAAADEAAVARGAYLAAAAGCDQCHTDAAHGGKPYAGGRSLVTAFGVITTPNLTGDRATGIGGWSAADFARAMRWGIAPDDTHYLPAFPFPFYNRLSARDLAAIKAFLDSLRPVSRPGLAGSGATSPWARARAAIAVVATPLPGPWQPDPSHDAVWNRGAYLVAAITRCGDCHTPRTVLGAPDLRRFLAGAPAGPDGKKVPNITPDGATGIGYWSVGDIIGLLTDGHTPEFHSVGGAMAEIVRDTARLRPADRRAIAVYLKSLSPVPTPAEK